MVTLYLYKFIMTIKVTNMMSIQATEVYKVDKPVA